MDGEQLHNIAALVAAGDADGPKRMSRHGNAAPYETGRATTRLTNVR